MVHPAFRQQSKEQLARRAAADDRLRVCKLQVREPLSAEEVDEYSRIACEAKYYNQGFRLHAVQADAILSLFEMNGGLCPIGVGWGKTIVSLKAAADFWQKKHCEKVLLMIPPEVYSQLLTRDIAWARKRVKMYGMPFIGLGQVGPAGRMVRAQSNESGCYIMPYSGLSNQDGEDVLSAVSPDLIILDECHRVKNMKAARTRRLRNFLDNKPDCSLIALSGTITNKTILDYHYILVRALGEHAPIPITNSRAVDWGCVVDSNADPSPEECQYLHPLLDWAVTNFPKEELEGDRRSFRTAYKLRLRSANGVIATSDEEIPTSLYMVNHDLKDAHDTSKDLIRLERQVVDDWLTPCGDEIDFAIHKAKWLGELASGFYYKLFWPDDVDEELLEKSQDFLEAQNIYHKALRGWLKVNARRGLDSPMLVGANMAKYESADVGVQLFSAYTQMKKADFDGRIERSREVVRLNPYKIEFAKKWAERMGHGILWYKHKAVGQWLQEEIPRAVYCPAGKKYDARIATTDGRLVIASYRAHGTGKNLQFHQNQLMVEFPRGAGDMQQLLGRLHRVGQEADEIHAHFLKSCDFDHTAYAAMLNDSLYIHQTGQRQKPIFAGYSPNPKIFPPEVLKERGFFDIKRLSLEDRRLLTEMFGASENLKN